MLLSGEAIEPARLVAAIWSPQDLGDPRRHRRLTKIVTGLLCGAAARSPKGVRAEDRGTDRFWDNEHLSPAKLERGGRAQMRAAILGLTVLVLAHDTSEIDVHGRGEPADAGPLRAGAARGYLLHGCSAIDPTHGALIGILDNWAWVRKWELQREDCKTRDAEKKESHKWIRGIKRARRQLKAAGFTGRVIHAADREADDYKVFAYARRSRSNVIIRARHDRAIVEGSGKLWTELESRTSVLGWSLRVAVERKRERRPAQTLAASAKAAATRTRRRAAQTLTS